MSKPQDPAAAETARTTDSPAVAPSTPCYPSLWDSLIMADGNAVEAHLQDAEELAKLHERGIVRGKKWIRLTDHGKKLRDAVILLG